MPPATPPEPSTIVCGAELAYERPPDLRLLHYNDVYHVEAGSAEPVGGIARFQTVCNYYRNGPKFKDQPKLITLFSGDAFNPSLESSVTKGRHMVPILNNIGTDVACVGNHDLDFGVAQYRNLTSQCKFPWLLANVIDPALGTDVPLGNALRTTTLTSTNDIKVGLIGLGEREWLATINSLPPNLDYRSASATAQELIPKLREEGAEIIIAVTHQREPNDVKLAEKTGADVIDIVLGGHDHYYNHALVNGVHVLRSGTDFKQLSYIEAWRKEDKGWDFRIERRDIISSIPEDEETLKVVGQLTEKLKTKLEKPVGYTLEPLDARFTTVRLKESNMGNFVCDLMRYYYDSDCCIMAGGTIRGDQIYPPGVVRLKDIMNCFPFEDPVVVIKATGKAIVEALENGVSTYPALEGRFPQVSGIQFTFDPSKPQGQRIIETSINGSPVELERLYQMSTRGYMARGKDGYDSLLVDAEGGQCSEVVSEENGVLISTIVRQFFMSMKILDRWRMWSRGMQRHWGNVLTGLNHSGSWVVDPTCKRPPKQRPMSQKAHPEDLVDSDTEPEDEPNPRPRSCQNDQEEVLIRRILRKWRRLAGVKEEGEACDALGIDEYQISWTKAIAPRLEGRIRIVGKDEDS